MASSGEIDEIDGISIPNRRASVRLLASRLVRGPSPRATGAGSDAFNRGVVLSAMGERDAAVAAYETSIAEGDRDIAARAAFNLAALWPDDPEAATSAYLSAIATAHPDVAPKAAFDLGSLLAARADLEGATGMLGAHRRAALVAPPAGRGTARDRAGGTTIAFWESGRPDRPRIRRSVGRRRSVRPTSATCHAGLWAY
jgi:hypothetical protein